MINLGRLVGVVLLQFKTIILKRDVHISKMKILGGEIAYS